MRKTAAKRKYTTITIPTKLFEKLRDRIENTGFSSVSDYATYILRETVADISIARQKGGNASGAVINKLKALGYLE